MLQLKKTGLGSVIIILTLGLGAGCSSKSPKSDDASIPSAVDATESMMGDSDSNNAMGLKTVRFAFDSFSLDSQSKGDLKSNAEVLKGNSNLRVQIEGHCDSRGGIQYNIALGEKRANSVRSFLGDMGISGDRITTISFGKERPIDPAENESAYAKNRRANFVITSK